MATANGFQKRGETQALGKGKNQRENFIRKNNEEKEEDEIKKGDVYAFITFFIPTSHYLSVRLFIHLRVVLRDGLFLRLRVRLSVRPLGCPSISHDDRHWVRCF